MHGTAKLFSKTVALLAEGVDRNHTKISDKTVQIPSPSSRRAWIEILCCLLFLCRVLSPSSRRAWIEIITVHAHARAKRVALLAEGVDRNKIALTDEHNIMVALLAEGVDRNTFDGKHRLAQSRSPSSRRAWIEIPVFCGDGKADVVALLAEGVDRNGYQEAWAEYRMKVALLAEGVDRNCHSWLPSAVGS